MNIRKAILGIIILLLVLIGYGWWQFERDHDLGEEAVSIIIQKGDSFGLVARRLVDQHVVQSQRVLSIAARLNGVDKRLIPGRYDFSGEVSCRSVLERLKAGDFLRIRVTIPEGATLRQV
ncbi:MAG: endolytic transglycosylase MltG [Candidatus Zixiibacteriota bacterium]